METPVEVFHLWSVQDESTNILIGTFTTEQAALDCATEMFGEQSNLDAKDPDWYIETGPFGWGVRLPSKSQRVVSFSVTLTLDRDNQPDDDMALTFAQYLTDVNGSFADDYGPGAWGGYDGPFVTHVRIVDDQGRTTDSDDTDWPKGKE